MASRFGPDALTVRESESMFQCIDLTKEPHDEFLNSFVDHFFECQTILLLGAGVSVPAPSCLPLAYQLMNPLQELLARPIHSIWENTPLPGRDFTLAANRITDARLERLLDVLTDAHGTDFLYYLQPLDSQKWNKVHSCFAWLTMLGRIAGCISLNFDTLYERALMQYGVSFRLQTPTICFKPTYPSARSIDILKPHGSFDPFQNGSNRSPRHHLHTTLSEIGTRPDHNLERWLLEMSLRRPHLFVAGYSDNDWDIFPVIYKHRSRFRRIYWFQYHAASAHNRALSFLRECADSWLIKGDLEQFLHKIYLSIIWKHPQLPEVLKPEFDSSPIQLVDLRAFPFSPNLDNERTLATALATAHLIESSGKVEKALLGAILKNSHVLKSAYLKWRLQQKLAHSAHTAGNYIAGLYRSVNAARLSAREEWNGIHSGHNSYLWLGYAILSLLKHPIRSFPLSLLGPIWLIAAKHCFSKAVAASPSHMKNRTKAYIEYYKGDVLHHFTLLGAIALGYFRMPKRLYRLVDEYYERASRIDVHLMEHEYYWMRRLEVQILSEAETLCDQRKEIEEKLEEIEFLNENTHNNVQYGNAPAYLGLFYAVCCGEFDNAERLFKRARDNWIKTGLKISAGDRRLKVFMHIYNHARKKWCFDRKMTGKI